MLRKTIAKDTAETPSELNKSQWFVRRDNPLPAFAPETTSKM